MATPGLVAAPAEPVAVSAAGPGLAVAVAIVAAEHVEVAVLDFAAGHVAVPGPGLVGPEPVVAVVAIAFGTDSVDSIQSRPRDRSFDIETQLIVVAQPAGLWNIACDGQQESAFVPWLGWFLSSFAPSELLVQFERPVVEPEPGPEPGPGPGLVRLALLALPVSLARPARPVSPVLLATLELPEPLAGLAGAEPGQLERPG